MGLIPCSASCSGADRVRGMGRLYELLGMAVGAGMRASLAELKVWGQASEYIHTRAGPFCLPLIQFVLLPAGASEVDLAR